MIEIEKGQVIQLLQDHVAGIVKNVGARMISDSAEKSLIGRSVVQVFSGMQLEARVHTGFIECIQDRQPAPPQFLERFVDQPRRPRRPRIEKRPRQRAGERCVRRQTHIVAGFCRRQQLLRCPSCFCLGIARQRSRRKSVEQRVERWMTRHQLTLQMCRQFCHLQAGAGDCAQHFFAIALALGSALQVEEPRIPTRDLDSYITQSRSPIGHSRKRVVWRLVPRKLR